MPKRLTPEDFTHNHLAKLLDGEAIHLSLFPGTYPSDRKSISGISSFAGHPFSELTHKIAARNGTSIGRLRVLPKIDSINYKADLASTMFMATDVATHTAINVRVTPFEPCLPGMIEACGEDSPIVKEYLEGAENGEPHNSLWLFYQRQMGGLVLSRIYQMHYKGDTFLGQEINEPPYNGHLARWAIYWESVYHGAPNVLTVGANATHDNGE